MRRNVIISHHRRHLYQLPAPHMVWSDAEHLAARCHVTLGQARASLGLGCTPTIATVASWRQISRVPRSWLCVALGNLQPYVNFCSLLMWHSHWTDSIRRYVARLSAHVLISASGNGARSGANGLYFVALYTFTLFLDTKSSSYVCIEACVLTQ